MVERVGASTAPMAAAQLRVLGGATARVPEHATAWDRLAAIKAQHDPDNVVRLNQNVPPAIEEAAA